MRALEVGLAVALACAGCGDAGSEADAAPELADTVIDAPGATGEGFGDSDHSIDGVHGGGAAAGNTDDVFSLGYAASEDDSVVLAWSGRRVTNGEGADFAVFENAFLVGGGPEAFMDPAIVHLSRDGASWVVFPHDYVAPDETAYSALAEHWQGFAGIAPVLLHEETNPVDPFDAAAAGGDQFDLDALANDGEAARIKAEGFSYLKIVSAPSQLTPDAGEPYVRDAISNGPDSDGAYGRYLAEE